MLRVCFTSGDLTDAKYADGRGSAQFESEWRDYYRTLQASGVTNKTVWFDIRGNHGNVGPTAILPSKTWFFTLSSTGCTGMIYLFCSDDAKTNSNKRKTKQAE